MRWWGTESCGNTITEALIQKAEQDYFSADERYLEKDFYIDIKNKKDFIFIQALMYSKN